MKFLLVAGARPNFMKIAPILEAFRSQAQRGNFASVKLVHTGQHYDRALSDAIFEDLKIPAPDIQLAAGSGSHAEQTARIMLEFEQVCLAERPDWVVVVGDVNSTLACALAAKKLGIRVAHVEAGLRSRDLFMPEEINRLCTDAISDVLFTTDEIASENLRSEGVCPNRIRFAGNTMIDTLFRHLGTAQALPLPFGLKQDRYAVLTLHRPSNVESPAMLRSLFNAIQSIATSIPIVFPAHPRTRRNLQAFGCLSGAPRDCQLRLVEPLSYLPFLSLVSQANFVLTDSGGIQEETTALGIPCLTLRKNTERPITCAIGTNILVGTEPAVIRDTALAVLGGEHRQGAIPPRWDGHAGARIVEELLSERRNANLQT